MKKAILIIIAVLLLIGGLVVGGMYILNSTAPKAMSTTFSIPTVEETKSFVNQATELVTPIGALLGVVGGIWMLIQQLIKNHLENKKLKAEAKEAEAEAIIAQKQARQRKKA